MKKKSQPEQIEPKVLRLPSASSDSPLVIDLPDGQKLVVGNLPNGTVIEVATWRGTGRPDSRTNRMMLGVSNADDNIEPKDEQTVVVNSETSQIRSKFIQLFKLPKAFLKWLFNINSKTQVNREKFSNKSKNVGFGSTVNKFRSLIKSKKIKQSSPSQLENDQYSSETDEWLQSILGKQSETKSVAKNESASKPLQSRKVPKSVRAKTGNTKKNPKRTKKS